MYSSTTPDGRVPLEPEWLRCGCGCRCRCGCGCGRGRGRGCGGGGGGGGGFVTLLSSARGSGTLVTHAPNAGGRTPESQTPGVPATWASTSRWTEAEKCCICAAKTHTSQRRACTPPVQSTHSQGKCCPSAPPTWSGDKNWLGHVATECVRGMASSDSTAYQNKLSWSRAPGRSYRRGPNSGLG